MIDIYIATHKKINFDLPPIYKWVQVNAEKNGPWEGYLNDAEGDNISSKNDSYCELTALYRLWKHSTAEIQGLCHYRRFLGKRLFLSLAEAGDNYYFRKEKIANHVLQEEEILNFLERTDVLLARSLYPYPFTAFEDLQRFVYLKDIEAMMTIIEEEYPDYFEPLQKTLFSTNISYRNIFIAKKNFTDKYCSWLFPLLHKIEHRIDISNYDKNHRRIFGYFAEVLLNVYIRKNKIRFSTLDVVNLDESTNDISFKRHIWLFNEKIRLFMGLFPLTYDPAINKVRYKWLQFAKDHRPTPPFTIDGIRHFYISLGCKEPSVEYNYGIATIYGQFFSFSVMSCIVNEKSQLLDIYQVAKIFRERPSVFEKANIIRAYCSFIPTEEEYICAMKNGVSLFYNMI